ncbi:MAG: alkaline phosphatase, partial [Phycisphaerae bacterium]
MIQHVAARVAFFAIFLGWAGADASAQSLTGVASGDVTADSAVLWARSTVTGDITFEYGTDATFASIDGTITVNVTDSMIPAKTSVTGLSENTRYYYRATDTLNASASGTFLTPALSGHHGFRMGVSGDWRGELAPYPAVKNVPNRNLSLWISLGDTIYADYASPAVPLPQAETLLDFRTKHLEVYSDRFGFNTLRALRESTALLAMIDDHEVTNDFAGGADPQTDPRFASDPAPFINETLFFQNGLTAFHDYNPIREDVWAGTGEALFDGKPKLYRAVRYGQDAAVLLLDARTFRDEELPEVENFMDLLEIFKFIVATFTPGRTMLGRPQLAALKNDLIAAQEDDVTWKFVIVPEPIQNLGFIAAADRFEGYAAERTELLEFINEHDIDNV